jgi:hypothetical protein
VNAGAFTGDLIGTASHATVAEYLTTSSLTLENLTITNTASIEYLNVVYQSSSVVYSSGSNIFGDAPDDTQTLHGQVDIIDNAHIFGALQVDGGISGNITGSLQGNANTATSAISASHAILADYAQGALSASYSATSDLAQMALSASYSATSDLAQAAISASYSATSDLAQSAISASHALVADHSQTAISASHALNSDYAQGALSASYSNTSDAAQTAISSSHAVNADNAVNAEAAVSASHALLADGLNAQDLTLANLTITNTASIEYLNVVYQSSSIIYSSGSNIFGDAPDDTQTLHGQVNIINDAQVDGALVVVGGITGDLVGSSSYAVHAATASFISTSFSAQNAFHNVLFVDAGGNGGAVQIDTGLRYNPSLDTLFTTASHALIADVASYVENAQSASYFLTSSVTSASFALSASHVVGAKDVGFQKEWHVSVGSGSDATGNGSLSKPFATLGKAFSVVGGTGEQIVVHPGLYLEPSASLTMPNVSICSANFNAGGICYFNGAITIAAGSSSTRISGILFNNLIHSGSAGLYLDKVQVKANYTKIGSGYSEIVNSDLQATGSVVFRGGTAIIQGDKVFAPVVSGSGTALYIKDVLSCVAPSAVAGGTLVLADSQIYPAVSGTAAVNSQAGTVTYIYNSQITTTTGLPERIAVSGFLGYDDVQFNKNLSTLGTSLNIRAHFQSLDANLLTATGSLFGNASTATSASFATIANGLNPGSSISAVNITGSGNLKVSGRINFANLPAYSDDAAAAAGGVEIGDLYRNGGFVIVRIS